MCSSSFLSQLMFTLSPKQTFFCCWTVMQKRRWRIDIHCCFYVVGDLSSINLIHFRPMSPWFQWFFYSAVIARKVQIIEKLEIGWGFYIRFYLHQPSWYRSVSPFLYFNKILHFSKFPNPTLLTWVGDCGYTKPYSEKSGYSPCNTEMDECMYFFAIDHKNITIYL